MALVAVLPVVAGFVAGSIPFAQIAARLVRGTDLRTVESGTVSGTNLYKVAGFVPLAVAGVLEVAKGAVGPLIAWDEPVVGAIAGGAAVVGHNWSPFLRGAGGRGISPSVGALLVLAWPGAALLLGGMAVGKLAGETAVGSFVADLLLVPLLWVTHGPEGALAGACVLVPMLVKRVVGNAPATGPGTRSFLHRLVLDRDPPEPTSP
ncbi:MAG: glycerol-3-phosphate acyltransferase [Acidimicrobiia bacterium]|nr:glycerol-3-phosphate acyltransferase [Acidimicrobiia bacterium]